MKTVTLQNLLKTFKPTKATINIRQFQKSEGWLTNGFFLVCATLEPKSSKEYRYRESDIKTQSLIDRVAKNLGKYEVAEIINHFELGGWDEKFLVKLQSENYTAWVNPRFVSYVYQGMAFFRDLKIMIGENANDPIAFVIDGEIKGLVMGFRKSEE